MATLQRSGGRAVPANTFEVYSWFFMRISGIVLLLVAVFHLLWMHLVIGVDNIDFNSVAQRWENPLWRIFYVFLLIFALGHGANGTRWVIHDYITSPGWRVFAKWVLYLIVIIVGSMGAYVIFTFQPPT